MLLTSSLQQRGGEGPRGDGLPIPQDQNPGNISGPQLVDVTRRRVTGASAVTSISGIRLWQNEVTDDERWG